MKTSKLILSAAAFVLLAGLSITNAQRPSKEQSFRPLPIESTHFEGVKSADGMPGFDMDKEEAAFGYTFLGQTSGAYPGSLTLSLNLTPRELKPGVENTIKSGSWTLPVYYKNESTSEYVGSLYGTITKGTINWDDPTSAQIFLELDVAGGTEKFEGRTGSATFVGRVFVDEKTSKTTLSGDLMITLSDPCSACNE